MINKLKPINFTRCSLYVVIIFLRKCIRIMAKLNVSKEIVALKKIAFFEHFDYFKSLKSSESSAPNIYLLLFSTVINIYITCIE